MTRIGLGCVGLGSSRDRRVADEIRLVRAAVDEGVTVFDTADVYGSGASERVLGRAIRGRRDEVVIATKGGFRFRDRRPIEQWGVRRAKQAREVLRSRRSGDTASGGGSGSYDRQDFSPRYLREAVHQSLRRIGTDRIDVYQLHGPDQVWPDLLDQLADLVTVGDVVRFGVGAGSVSTADAWAGVRGVAVLQVPFGVLDPEAAGSTLPRARGRGLEVWVRGVLGGGLLGVADRRGVGIEDHPKRAMVQAIGRIAAESGFDQFELALGFVRARAGGASTVLVGTTSIEHLRRNVLAVAAPPLPADVMAALDELTSERA